MWEPQVLSNGKRVPCHAVVTGHPIFYCSKIKDQNLCVKLNDIVVFAGIWLIPSKRKVFSRKKTNKHATWAATLGSCFYVIDKNHKPICNIPPLPAFFFSQYSKIWTFGISDVAWGPSALTYIYSLASQMSSCYHRTSQTPITIIWLILVN